MEYRTGSTKRHRIGKSEQRAHNEALRYLADPSYQLSEIRDLIALVHSSDGRFDPVAARRAREWLSRRMGQ